MTSPLLTTDLLSSAVGGAALLGGLVQKGSAFVAEKTGSVRAGAVSNHRLLKRTAPLGIAVMGYNALRSTGRLLTGTSQDIWADSLMIGGALCGVAALVGRLNPVTRRVAAIFGMALDFADIAHVGWQYRQGQVSTHELVIQLGLTLIFGFDRQSRQMVRGITESPAVPDRSEQLNRIMEILCESDPNLKQRFRGAVPEGTPATNEEIGFFIADALNQLGGVIQSDLARGWAMPFTNGIFTDDPAAFYRIWALRDAALQAMAGGVNILRSNGRFNRDPMTIRDPDVQNAWGAIRQVLNHRPDDWTPPRDIKGWIAILRVNQTAKDPRFDPGGEVTEDQFSRLMIDQVNQLGAVLESDLQRGKSPYVDGIFKSSPDLYQVMSVLRKMIQEAKRSGLEIIGDRTARAWKILDQVLEHAPHDWRIPVGMVRSFVDLHFPLGTPARKWLDEGWGGGMERPQPIPDRSVPPPWTGEYPFAPRWTGEWRKAIYERWSHVEIFLHPRRIIRDEKRRPRLIDHLQKHADVIWRYFGLVEDLKALKLYILEPQGYYEMNQLRTIMMGAGINPPAHL